MSLDAMNGRENLTVDFGYISPCALEVTKSCVVPEPPQEFICSDAKPIDSLSMIWDGAETISITAYRGPVGNQVLAEIDNIEPGELVTVTGYAGAPNDNFWEVFTADRSTKLGESKFHISCSDDDMDGPEDCGKLAGNGKDDAGFINEWVFAGMAGNGLALDCYPVPAEPTAECSVQLQPAPNCETYGRPDSLTFQYTGGGCGATTNLQEGRVTCVGAINPALAVTITAPQHSGYVIDPATVLPGETFTVYGNGFDSQSTFLLTDAAGNTVELSIHTSCSKPLVVGDVFGDLTLIGFNNQGDGSEVVYEYVVTNPGSQDLAGITLTDDVLGEIVAGFGLAAGESISFSVPAAIIETVTNIATVTVDGQPGCDATSNPVTVTVVPPPCQPEPLEPITFKDRKLDWKLINNSGSQVTITKLVLSWPASNGILKKVKLDADTVWDDGSPVGDTSITLNEADLTTDLKKKSIKAGDDRRFRLEFEKNASTNLDEYTLEIWFGDCVVVHPPEADQP